MYTTTMLLAILFFFFFQAEDGIRDYKVTGVQTCALPILSRGGRDRGPQRLAARPDIPWLARLMYARILVPLEHSPADDTILAHVRGLAKRLGSAVVLIHVADGWVARNIKELELRESEEMREDRAYLEEVSARLEAEGL